MKMEIIKPSSKRRNNKSLLVPIMYLIIGVLLAFKSNEIVTMLFYVIGVLLIMYGIKSPEFGS